MRLNIIDDKQNIWHVSFVMPENTVYANEQYTLQFAFDDKYPFECAEVKFIGKPPEHEHVYANGYICLSTLSTDWTPALQTSSVVVSIISMLASAKAKRKPDNDERMSDYMNRVGSPKKVSWIFEDDKC